MNADTAFVIFGLGLGVTVAGALIFTWLYIRAFYALQKQGDDMRTFLKNRMSAMKIAFVSAPPKSARVLGYACIIGGTIISIAGGTLLAQI